MTKQKREREFERQKRKKGRGCDSAAKVNAKPRPNAVVAASKEDCRREQRLTRCRARLELLRWLLHFEEFSEIDLRELTIIRVALRSRGVIVGGERDEELHVWQIGNV